MPDLSVDRRRLLPERRHRRCRPARARRSRHVCRQAASRALTRQPLQDPSRGASRQPRRRAALCARTRDLRKVMLVDELSTQGQKTPAPRPRDVAGGRRSWQALGAAPRTRCLRRRRR
jgi:hypothetical protein